MGGSSGGGAQQPVTSTTTSNSDPWSGAVPYLSHGLAHGDYLLTNDVGYRPYTGPYQADVSGPMASGMGYNASVAQANLGGGPGLQAARGLAQNMINTQGVSPGIAGAIGQMQGAAGQYGGVYNRAGDVYNQASGQQNPYLLAQIAANDRRIADKINSSVSGAGRYGSAAHTDVLGRSLAEAANPILAADYTQRQATRLAALQGQQAATAGQQGVYGNIADIYGQGLNRAGQWAQLTPTLDAAQYAPGDLLMGIGQWQMDRQAQQLAHDASLYNAWEARPWEQLARFTANVGGAGGLGGTKVGTTTSQTAPPPLSNRIFGGALAGGGLGSMFGPVGAGIGAAGGGLLGLLG
jgi:hypothetical protein